MNTRILKIGRNILFMLSVPVIISAFVFADVSTRNELCRGVQISFSNDQLSFVTRENVLDILKKENIVVNKTPLQKIRIRDIEQAIEQNKWVSRANIFASADMQLHIFIEQKKPVVRIQPGNEWEEPFYLDEYGNSILYSTQYVPDLPVVSAAEFAYYSDDRALKSDIVKLAKYLAKDSFWNAAITQVSIDSEKNFSLVPAFGTQMILLGSVENLDQKMAKLFQFYKQGYYTVRWDKYDEIDLRFERQVVCRNTRGERISVDPYDKTTHKELVAANTTPIVPNVDNQIPASVKPSKPATPKPQSSSPAKEEHTIVSAKPNVALATPVKAAVVHQDNDKTKTVTNAAQKENANTLAAKGQPKANEKVKAIAKSDGKEAGKPKNGKSDNKPAMTEVVNSKYFNKQ